MYLNHLHNNESIIHLEQKTHFQSDDRVRLPVAFMEGPRI